MTEELCVHCGTFEHLHIDGACPPLRNQTDAPIRPGQPGHAGLNNILPGNFKRKRGRPKGSKNQLLAARIERQSILNTKGALKRELAQKLREAQDAALEEAGKKLGAEACRIPRNPEPIPDRTIAECKDAALKVISRQLWDLEGIAKERSLTEYEEARILKLLAGFNAALPKTAEKPAPKDLKDMTEDEIKALLKGDT